MDGLERISSSSAALLAVYGYVEYIQVEQMNSRDQVTVKLRQYNAEDDLEGEAFRYTTYLDTGTTVALAQLQLLRQGLDRGGAVKLRYVETTDHRWMYSVVLYGPSTRRVLFDGTEVV